MLRDLETAETEMCSGSEGGSYLRLIEFCILNSRLESDKEEEEKDQGCGQEAGRAL